MAIPRYSPPLERIKEEYSRMVRQRVMARRRPPRPDTPPRQPIPDNSEPWIRNPRTVADLMEIAKCVQRQVDRFQRWRSDSKDS